MATPHNKGEKKDIAKTVIMPGDPLRAKFIAQNWLTSPVLFTDVRNMYGYTGTYQGMAVSVMGSGMGMPSMGIYSYELFRMYDVDAIIRVGSAGSYCDRMRIFDTMLVTSAFSESSYALVQNGCKEHILQPSADLNKKLGRAAENLLRPLVEGRVHSTDVFYREGSKDYYRELYEKQDCLAVEMESFALFHNANVCGKKAACLLTISDSFVSEEITTAEERERSFTDMIEIALKAAVS